MSETSGGTGAWNAAEDLQRPEPAGGPQHNPAPSGQPQYQPAPGVQAQYQPGPSVQPHYQAGPVVHSPYPSHLQHGSGQNRGPLGTRRSVGTQVLLAFVTLGIYGLYWAYVSHDEVKRHTGEGVGGLLGLVIFMFLGIVSLFLLPLEIKRMYEREGLHSPVSGATAFWVLLFGIPWYVKCQTALNQYWALKGVPA